jgi:hypothetical protein
MRRTFTVRKTSDNQVELRAGESVLGTLANLREAGGDVGMLARFENAPAFVDHRDTFRQLAKALEAGEGGREETARLRGVLEAAGVHVHHVLHDMRIDEPASLTLIGGEVRFRPTGSFLMMRSGGLG